MVVSAFCQAVVASECIATPQQAVKVEYENPQRAEQRLIFWRYQGEVAWETRRLDRLRCGIACLTVGSR